MPLHTSINSGGVKINQIKAQGDINQSSFLFFQTYVESWCFLSMNKEQQPIYDDKMIRNDFEFLLAFFHLQSILKENHIGGHAIFAEVQ